MRTSSLALTLVSLCLSTGVSKADPPSPKQQPEETPEQSNIRVINEIRQAKDLPPLKESPGLAKIAQAQCEADCKKNGIVILPALWWDGTWEQDKKEYEVGYKKDQPNPYTKEIVETLERISSLDVPYTRAVALSCVDEEGLANKKPEFVVGAMLFDKHPQRFPPPPMVLHKKIAEIGVAIVHLKEEDQQGDVHDRVYYTVIISASLPKPGEYKYTPKPELWNKRGR